ncbi:MAG: S8 family peptidase [Elainellaceae cyanobacterium]
MWTSHETAHASSALGNSNGPAGSHRLKFDLGGADSAIVPSSAAALSALPTDLGAQFEDSLQTVIGRSQATDLELGLFQAGDLLTPGTPASRAYGAGAAAARDPLTGLGESLALPDVTPPPGQKRVVKDALAQGDDKNPARSGRFKDDYLLTSGSDRRLRVDMVSRSVDAFLQIIDGTTGRVVAANNDGPAGTNSRLIFDAEADTDYFIRATSRGKGETGRYRLKTRFMVPGAAVLPAAPAAAAVSRASAVTFSAADGYGFVDAAAAVAATSRLQPRAIANGRQSWNNSLINAPEVWANGITGQGTVVAVIDSGVDLTHPDLNQNLWRNRGEIAGNGIDDDGNGYVDDVRGWDFIGGDNRPLDLNGHGTHVAGTIAAENNGLGVTGVAYGADIMPIRVLDADGAGSINAIAAGIRYAADNGADVINLSLGGDAYTPLLDTAVRYAARQGAVVVSAAGNSGLAQPGYPAQFATASGLSVGAVDYNQRLAGFSNRAGSNPQLRHVVAPGVNVTSTVPGGYGSLSGTSMAAPHVSGVVALMLSANPSLTPAQVREIIVGTTV